MMINNVGAQYTGTGILGSTPRSLSGYLSLLVRFLWLYSRSSSSYYIIMCSTGHSISVLTRYLVFALTFICIERLTAEIASRLKLKKKTDTGFYVFI